MLLWGWAASSLNKLQSAHHVFHKHLQELTKSNRGSYKVIPVTVRPNSEVKILMSCCLVYSRYF